MRDLVTLFISLSLLLAGCEKPSPTLKTETQALFSHPLDVDGKKLRYPLFFAKVPVHWKEIDQKQLSSTVDTKLPIAEFEINNSLRLKVHHFPRSRELSPIPPQAQVERWKNQLQEYSDVTVDVQPVSWGGFFGLQMDASYQMESEELALFAWALQLDRDLERELRPQNRDEERYYSQMRGEYTVKISGPEEELNAHKDEIDSFVHSIHLVQELPEAHQ